MTAGWVACSVRARAITRRRLGHESARALAASPTLAQAIVMLRRSPYAHDVREGQQLAEAQRAVVDTLLWNVRVLAGWAPGAGVAMLRSVASPLVAVNVEEHLQRLAGEDRLPPFRLGALSTTWPRLAHADSPAEVCRVLAASPWGDPHSESPRDIVLTMRAVAAERVMATAPPAAPWAAAATALLFAREVLRDGRELPPYARSVAARVIGNAAVSTATLPELAGALLPSARWALADVAGPDDLWHAESSWWRHVERDAFPLVHVGIAGPENLLGSVALLAVDAWRVRAALESAARGGAALEDFDAVA